MKIGETWLTVFDANNAQASILFPPHDDGWLRDTFVKTLDETRPHNAPHRVVPVTLQPAGDAELLERAVKALEKAVNLCQHQGPSPERIRQFSQHDHWIADLWEEADAIIAAARREVE